MFSFLNTWCRTASHFLHSIAYKSHSSMSNEAFIQSLLLKVSLQEHQPVHNMSTHLIFKLTEKQQSDLPAPSSISTFKLWLSLFLSDSTGFSPGCSSWHQLPLLLQALVFTLSLYSPSNSFSTTTLSSAAPSSQESVLNSLIPVASFPPFAFQALSLIYLSPWPILFCSLSATDVRTP